MGNCKPHVKVKAEAKVSTSAAKARAVPPWDTPWAPGSHRASSTKGPVTVSPTTHAPRPTPSSGQREIRRIEGVMVLFFVFTECQKEVFASKTTADGSENMTWRKNIVFADYLL